jgi:hypothetical protein
MSHELTTLTQVCFLLALEVHILQNKDNEHPTHHALAIEEMVAHIEYYPNWTKFVSSMNHE